MRIQLVSRRVRESLAAVLLGGLLLAGLPAAGQSLQPPPGLEEAMRPDFVRRDMQVFVDALDLNEGQQVIARTLYGDYEQAVRDGTERLRVSAPVNPALLTPSDELAANRDLFRRQMLELMEEMAERQRQLPADADPQSVREEFIPRIEKLRQLLRSDRPREIDPAKLEAAMAQFASDLEAWKVRKVELSTEFVTSLKSLLTDEQLQRWPALERRMLRERSLPRGRLSGESLNLLLLVEQLKLDAEVRRALHDTLTAYEHDLNDALVSRDAVLAETQAPLTAALHERDAAAGEAIVRRQVEHRVAVRDVNSRCVEAVAALLPEDTAALFRGLVRERVHPRIYGPTITQRLISSVRELPDLPEETLSAVEAIDQQYRSSLHAVNAELEETVIREEPEQMVRLIARRWRRPTPSETRGRLDSPIEKAFAQRNLMGEPYERQIGDLLTAEQRAQVPGLNRRRLERGRREAREAGVTRGKRPSRADG